MSKKWRAELGVRDLNFLYGGSIFKISKCGKYDLKRGK
jgi:hypothetical protein